MKRRMARILVFVVTLVGAVNIFAACKRCYFIPDTDCDDVPKGTQGYTACLLLSNGECHNVLPYCC